MKKFGLALVAALTFAVASNAQVMKETGFKDTIWTGFGVPLQGKFGYYGVMNTLQTHHEITLKKAKFTIEGMLNVGFLANYEGSDHIKSFSLEISERNPLQFHYGQWRDNTCTVGSNDNSFDPTNVRMDPFYVNFIWRLGKSFDLGLGTKLNWQVGPAPGYGGWLWESTAHVRQGGFATRYDDRHSGVSTHVFTIDVPGTADVVGFVPYANKYAKTAFGFRFQTSDIAKGFEIGLSIPITDGDGWNIPHNLSTNLGLRIAPADWISIAAVWEGMFANNWGFFGGSNIYAGVTFGKNKFLFEIYTSADSLFTSRKDDIAVGTGLAITFKIGKSNQFMLRPEGGINFFENHDFSCPWYVGLTFDWSITDLFGFGAFSSWGVGSKNRTWEDFKATEDWIRGHIFNVRPIIHFTFNKTVKLSAYAQYEFRRAFDREIRHCFSSGVYLELKF